MTLKTIYAKCYHFYMKLFGSFPDKGFKEMPCIGCGKYFISYEHHDWRYDTTCEDCLKRRLK